MRSASVTARELIEAGGFSRQWVADLMYNGDRRIADVPLAADSVSLSWDAGSFVTGSGQAQVVWADDFGSSMIPSRIGDWFSPFGAELQIDCIIGAGVFAERVPVGRFVIEDVTDAAGVPMVWDDRVIHPGETFTVSVKDTLVRVSRDEFAFPTASTSTSVWSEIQSVTGMPVIRNVPDAAIPSSIAYEGDKSDAVNKLFDRLDAWPYTNQAGILTSRPKAWAATVDDIRGVVSAPRSMTAKATYNRVVVEGKSPAGDPIYAVAEITDGPLRTRNSDGSLSPFGVVTYRYQSDYLHTMSQCRDYADSLLPRVSRLRGVTREVEEPFNPLREVGDVLRFEGGVVRAAKVSHTTSTTRMTVEVPDQ